MPRKVSRAFVPVMSAIVVLTMPYFAGSRAQAQPSSNPHTNVSSVVQGSAFIPPHSVTQLSKAGSKLDAYGNNVLKPLLPSSSGASISSLVLNSGKTLVIDFSKTPILDITHDLRVDRGATIYAISTNPAIHTVTIDASNILNAFGGTITSVLPSGGLPGFGNAVSGVNLDLVASLSITNHGSISNNGSNTTGGAQLSLTAPFVVNSGEISAKSGSLNIAANIVTNSGTVNAAQNLQIENLSGDSLNISNTNGQLNATGNMNLIATSKSNSLPSISLNGGNLLSQQLNLSAGQSGIINVNADNISGIVNALGNSAHVLANTSLLRLGNNNLRGDPTYFNTGSIQISSNISVGEDLTIIAGGDVTTTSAVNSISTINGTGQGHNITIISGAHVTTSCGTCSSNAAAGTQARAIITVDPSSPGGGDIDFSASPNLVISSDSNSGNLNGGNVTLAAFSNGAVGGHIVLAPSSQINSSGSGNGNNGNVALIAGAVSGTGISAGQITANGGTGTASGTGLITLITAQPTTSDGAPIKFGTNGSITSGNNISASSTLQAADVFVGNAVSSSGKLTVSAGGNILESSLGSITGTITGAFIDPAAVLSPDGSKLYVLSYNGETNTGSISTVDTATGATLGTILLSNAQPEDMVINPSGTLGFLTTSIPTSGSSDLLQVNLQTGATHTIAGPTQFFRGLALSPDGSKLYVPDYNGNSTEPVFVYSTTTLQQIGTVPVGSGPFSIALSPTKTFGYVNNLESNSVSVFNTTTNQVVATIPVSGPVQLAISPNGGYVYVSSLNSNAVQVIDTSKNAVVATIPMAQEPSGITFNSAGTLAFVANSTNNLISIISTSTNSVVGFLPTGNRPEILAISPSGNSAYVANGADYNISVYSLSTSAAPSGLLTSSTGISLSSTNGTIGTSSGPLSANAPVFQISGNGAGKSVSINNLNSNLNTVQLLDSYSGGDFQFVSIGNLNISNLAAGGNIVLNNNGYYAPTLYLSVAASAKVQAGGSVTMSNSNGANGILEVGANASILAGGNVSIAVGTPLDFLYSNNPGSPINVSAVELNGGTVDFGRFGLVSTPSQSTVTANNGKNASFAIGSDLSGNAISLGGNVNITAGASTQGSGGNGGSGGGGGGGGSGSGGSGSGSGGGGNGNIGGGNGNIGGGGSNNRGGSSSGSLTNPQVFAPIVSLQQNYLELVGGSLVYGDVASVGTLVLSSSNNNNAAGAISVSLNSGSSSGLDTINSALVNTLLVTSNVSQLVDIALNDLSSNSQNELSKNVHRTSGKKIAKHSLNNKPYVITNDGKILSLVFSSPETKLAHNNC